VSPITDTKPQAEVKSVVPTPLVASAPTSSPAITSKNLPTPPAPATVTVEHDGSPIVAAPLVTPDFTNLKKKNPNIDLRWVNRVAGREELGSEGARYGHMKAMGFVNATVNDVEVPPHLLHNGAIVQGDLILMKIDRRIYQGALLDNANKARARTTPRSFLNAGSKQIHDALNEVPGTTENRRKIQPFIPGRVDSLENDR
jgi:hypothetical protein